MISRCSRFLKQRDQYWEKEGGLKMIKKMAFGRLGLFVFILTACLITFSGASAQEKKEILIGAPLSLSGILAMDGIEQQWAYEQAANDINKTGASS